MAKLIDILTRALARSTARELVRAYDKNKRNSHRPSLTEKLKNKSEEPKLKQILQERRERYSDKVNIADCYLRKDWSIISIFSEHEHEISEYFEKFWWSRTQQERCQSAIRYSRIYMTTPQRLDLYGRLNISYSEYISRDGRSRPSLAETTEFIVINTDTFKILNEMMNSKGYILDFHANTPNPFFSLAIE
ncbi:hypothetical protein [Paenibacillus sp. OK003]|uniref:hypothetical protein n=1 Tax=Paenibacillus sp. OK003 TaxID=1884380 RepID=UPI0008C653EC|nr:hypothetical protein [Paenibacillus sp. OK003]SEL28987.1 hypothetical protein SAMN05518856_109161 [Paenibacillus sp. OK003]